MTFKQEDTIHWLTQLHLRHQEEADDRLASLFARYAVKATRIASRSFDIADAQNLNWDEMRIYGYPPGQIPDVADRLQFYANRTQNIFRELYHPESEPPGHIIHVTCTGYISPSAAQHLVNDNRWFEKTAITHAYHMGCYASMPAIRMAMGFVSSDLDRVDIVHNEICGLHLNPLANSPEQIIVQSLFADGHIKYSITPTGKMRHGFAVINIIEQIVPDSIEDMSWIPASWGMSMTLSREIPTRIRDAIKPFLEKLISTTGQSLEQILKEAKFAIHPGGPKIIELLQEILRLSDEQVENSKKILLDRGNMSSATLPHVWQDIMDYQYTTGRYVVSLAFGPGLTLFGSLFQMI